MMTTSELEYGRFAKSNTAGETSPPTAQRRDFYREGLQLNLERTRIVYREAQLDLDRYDADRAEQRLARGSLLVGAGMVSAGNANLYPNPCVAAQTISDHQASAAPLSRLPSGTEEVNGGAISDLGGSPD